MYTECDWGCNYSACTVRARVHGGTSSKNRMPQSHLFLTLVDTCLLDHPVSWLSDLLHYTFSWRVARHY